MHINRLKIIALYSVMFFGGLWNILGLFKTVMEYSAGPLLIALGFWLFYEHWHYLEHSIESAEQESGASPAVRFSIFAGLVILVLFLVEMLAVHTGWIFGEYSYGSRLLPQWINVPVAIGFAWFITFISSAAICQRISLPVNFRPLIIALLMTGFDFFMEPVAIKLNYWQWTDSFPPFQNFAAWFILSYMIAWLAHRFRILEYKFPEITMHSYFAQIIYFGMVFIWVK